MTESPQRSSAPPGPVTSLDDPRVVQILSTEHWSQLSARSLAYNEAFTRGGMFLSFLSMSFVGMALLAQAMGFGRDFLTVAAIVLAFDFVIGITTLGRIGGANIDDLRAMHGMARIRHGYTQIAPMIEPYFTSPTHDDVDSVLIGYGASEEDTVLATAWYVLTTSAGMIGLITSMVGGVLVAVLAILLLAVGGGAAIGIGIGAAIAIFVVTLGLFASAIPRNQARLVARFPAEAAPAPEPAATEAPDR